MATDALTAPATRPAAALSAAADHAAHDIARTVEAELHAFVTEAAAELRDWDDALRPLARLTADAVLVGGKRLRPTFAYWGWRGVAGPDAPVAAVAPALAALELLHAFALVHDDVMDESAQRRGRPTTHRAFAALHAAHELRGDAERFGRSAAILVGDLCLVWADRMIERAALSPPARAATRRRYDAMRAETIAGQYLDVWSESAREWTVDAALRTAELKTASYTVTSPLLYGAALAGHPRDGIERAYADFGANLGVAFQLRDDLLGLYGNPAVTGKPVGDDIGLAKPTVLLQIAREMATPRQATLLARILLPGNGESQTARVADLVREIGAVDRVEMMIGERVARARRALTDSVDPITRQALLELAGTCAWRAA